MRSNNNSKKNSRGGPFDYKRCTGDFEKNIFLKQCILAPKKFMPAHTAEKIHARSVSRQKDKEQKYHTDQRREKNMP